MGKLFLPGGGEENGKKAGGAALPPPLFVTRFEDLQICLLSASQMVAAGMAVEEAARKAFEVVAEVVARYEHGGLPPYVDRARRRVAEERRVADLAAADVPKAPPDPLADTRGSVDVIRVAKD